MANYKNIVAHTKYSEGGKSKDPRDNASANPVPDGSGYHTNKGVTWATFVSLAPKIGYQATAAVFYVMPMDIWLKIYKIGYWDKIDGDNIKSQAVADMLVSRAWGSGSTRANKMIQQLLVDKGYKVAITGVKNPSTTAAINLANNTIAKEKSFYNEFKNRNLAYLMSLDDWETYKNGWTTRLNKLYANGLSTIGANPGQTAFFFDGHPDSDHIS